MDEMVYLYCDQLKGSLEMEFIAGMRALSKESEEEEEEEEDE